MTRRDVLEKASLECLKELYTKVQPAVDWEDFLQQNIEYSEKYEQWERLEDRSNLYDYCGPRPYEFYYLPKEIMKDVCDSYVDAYKLDHQQELLDTIETLKNYCKEPIVDKYIDDWTDETGFHHPGYRSYDHPNNLEREIFSILKENSNYWKSAIGEANPSDLSKELQNKFFEFLDMAGNFYNWNRDLNAFNMTVYLGPSPCSNKETVIKNWKIYRNKDITIDESVYIEED